MKYSAKRPAPQSYVDWLGLANEDWKPSYAALQRPEISDVRAALLAEQEFVCCYCGRGLKDDQTDCHIDHFRPQKQYDGKTRSNPDLTLDFNNFVASCGPPKESGHPSTCGDAKGDQFNEDAFIEPWDTCCEARFKYGLAGAVMASRADDRAADYMIGILALDHRALVNERATLLAGIEGDIRNGQISAATAEAEIQRWQASQSGRRIGFSHIVVRYLQVEFGLS